jgi:dTDP-4-dehydrorhamnose 3,5-epimerase
MDIERLEIEGLIKLTPRQFKDDRGVFWETWREGMLKDADGNPLQFVQENLSISKAGTLRGLHFQREPHAQGKLVRAVSGRIWDVAVDMRASSATRGQWYACELSDANGCQLWIPEGFAHGFLAMTDHAVVEYRCTALYAPQAEGSIRWNDASIGVNWRPDGFEMPEGGPFLSEKDAIAPLVDASDWPFN